MFLGFDICNSVDRSSKPVSFFFFFLGGGVLYPLFSRSPKSTHSPGGGRCVYVGACSFQVSLDMV